MSYDSPASLDGSVTGSVLHFNPNDESWDPAHLDWTAGETDNANIHHYVAFVSYGYWLGAELPIAVNHFRERDLPGRPENKADIAMGDLGARQGAAMRPNANAWYDIPARDLHRLGQDIR